MRSTLIAMISGIKVPQSTLSDDGLTLSLVLNTGPFDSSHLRVFKSHLRDIWCDSIEQIEIDFSEVTFIDSPMVGALIHLHQCLLNEAPLQILDPNPTVAKTLDLFEMGSVFQIHCRTA